MSAKDPPSDPVPTKVKPDEFDSFDKLKPPFAI